MRLDDLVRISLRQVLRQRRRNLGVILAIALGTAGFIVVITMGQDVKDNLNTDLELLGGATRIKVSFGDLSRVDYLTASQWFRDETIHALREVPEITGVSAIVILPGAAVTMVEKTQTKVYLVGVDQYFWPVNSFKAETGTLFEAEDLAEGAKVCVLGPNVAIKLFGKKEVIGRLLPLGKDLFRVIGVLGGLSLADRSDWIFIPITTYADRLPGDALVRTIYVRCRTWDDVEKVADLIPKIISDHQSARDLKVEVAWEHLKHIRRLSWWFQLFIYVAIVATLVLGGFGIWNIQMVAVRARTREIGLKKAIGAEDEDILYQFLAEALCMSLVSALIGVALGRLGVEVVSYFLQSRPPEGLFLMCVGLGILFSIVLGMGAGLYPSIKASRMEVVTALRYE